MSYKQLHGQKGYQKGIFSWDRGKEHPAQGEKWRNEKAGKQERSGETISDLVDENKTRKSWAQRED